LETNSTRKKSSNSTGKKSKTVNLLLNVSIFLLSVLILYMLYSLYVRLFHRQIDSINPAGEQVASDMIQVDVLNGCGVGGVGDRFTDFLRNNGIDVVKVGNYISNDVGESLIIDRTGNLANAYKVAKTLGIKNENVIQQLNKEYFLDVTIVIGRDYFNLSPFK
jgi:hypothetical protein